jgi:hypothetical protein
MLPSQGRVGKMTARGHYCQINTLGDGGGMSALCSESDGRPDAIRRGMQRRR